MTEADLQSPDRAYPVYSALCSADEAVNMTRARLGPLCESLLASLVALTENLRFVAWPEGNVTWSVQPSMYVGADR